MSRPRSEVKFHVYPQSDTAVWWVWFWAESSGVKKRRRISTASLVTGPLSRDEYTLEEAQKTVNDATGVKTHSESHGKLTVNWVMEYMEDRIAVEGKKKATWDHYRSSLLMFKEIYGGNYHLAKFRPQNIYDFQSDILKAGKSPVTVNTYCRGMAAIYHRLKKSGLLAENPFTEFERIREPKKKEHLEKEERTKFMEEVDKLENQNIARLIKILAYTGMRRSEVLNIRRDDVDLLGNRFMVTNIKARDKRKRWLSIPAVTSRTSSSTKGTHRSISAVRTRSAARSAS